MTLDALWTLDPVQIASGQYHEISCRFQAGGTLIGQEIAFSPLMWSLVQEPLTSSSAPTNNVFKAVYPASGTVEMTWFGDDHKQNWKARIEYVSATTFDLFLEFVASTDLNGYASTEISNLSRFTVEALASSVYDQTKYLVMAVWLVHEDNPANDVLETVSAPFNLSKWFDEALPTTFKLKISGSEVDGYIIGQDLEVIVHIDGSGDPVTIGNQYYVALIKETPTTSGNLVDAHRFGYAFIDGSANAVSDLDNPFTAGAILDSPGGLGLSNQYEGELTIGGAHFIDGECYHVIVIYNVDGLWTAAKSEAFCNIGAPNVPTYGDITVQISQGGNDYANECASNVVPCETLDICVTMDPASYNTDASDNGTPGTYATNLQQINVYDSPVPLIPGQSIDEITGLSLLGTTTDGCFSLLIPEDWSGEDHFIVFEYVFFIDDDTPYYDYIYYAVPVSVVDISSPGYLTLDSIHDVNDAVFLNDRICLDYDDVVKLNLVHSGASNHALDVIDPHGLVLSSPANFAAGIAQVIVDANKLALDLDRCLKFIATPVAPGETTCTCFDIDLTATVVSTENGVTVIDLDWNLDSPPDTVQAFIIKQGGDPAQEFTGTSGTVQYQIETNDNKITLFFVIMVILENGCVYTTTPSIEVYNITGSTNTVDYDICLDPPSGELTCDNVALLSGVCNFDIGAGTLTVTPTFDGTGISSPINTETKEYNLNGDGWVAYGGGDIDCGFIALFDYLALRWTVTFNDDCPDQVYSQIVQCFRTPPDCNNKPKIICLFDDATDTFTINVNNNAGGSDVDEWNIMYSEDGGATFDPYTAPFVVDPAVDSIIATAYPEYADSCPPGPLLSCSWIRDDDANNCDYDEYDLTSVFDEGTGAHIPTFTGDEDPLEVNIKEYSLDGGLTWTPYVTNPVGQLVIFRWTIQFPGCCEEILVSASQEPQIGTQIFRIVDDVIDLGALGAPEDTFTLNIPAGFELINADHVIPYLNNARLFEGVDDFGWSVDIGTGEITYGTAFDPAEWPTGILVHEYWVKSIV